MKHTLFMVGLLVATVPATLVNPFVGLAVYYGLATLCPQFLWKQALPEWRWSMIVGLATVVSFVGHGFARSRAGARWPIEKKLMLAFGGLIVLSMVDAVEPNLAWQQFDNIMKIFIMFFIACAVLDSRHRLSVLAVVVVAALGWVAFDFNQRYILMGQKAVASTGFAGIDNNGIAAIMVMGIPFCVLLFSQAKRWYLKLVPMAALVLMAHVVLFSMSRGGMLALLIIIPVLFLRLRRRLIGVALLVLLSLVGFRLAGQEVRKRFMSIQDYESDSSAQIRLTAWRAGLQVIRDYPVFGVGPACFYSISGNYDYNIQNRAMHNLFLQTAVDMGLPAAGVLVAILLFSLWHLQKLRRRHKDDSFICDITNCLQAVLLGYIVTGMFVSIGTLELPYIALAMTVGLRNIVAEGAPSLAVETPQQQKRNTGPFPGRMKPATT